MGLTIPTDHADPYLWLVVLLAHAAVGLALVAVLAALLDALGRASGLGAWLVVTLGYALAWEGAVQRLGAGLADAAIDSAAVALGGLIGLLAWRRHGTGLTVALVLLAGIAARGVGRRK